MQTTNKMVFTAKNVSELLYQLKTVSNLQVIGASTYIKTLPEKSISVRNIPELCIIDKHERYVEFGPGVTLNSILSQCKNYLPQVLADAIHCIANHNIRNIATIGGNICAKDYRLSLIAPLLALDCSLKFKSLKKDEYINLKNFTFIPPESVLAAIRVPVEDYNVSIYRKLGPNNALTAESGSFCFLAQTEKNILMKLKLVFSGPFNFINRELETKFLGTKLPLNESAIQDFIATAGERFDELSKENPCSPILRQQFLNLTAFSLHELT
ncbi:MAG: FAD binding domain-containing protein [Treponema sp.]|nr:FAD binding domain-containing protein [Treponema sp.]